MVIFFLIFQSIYEFVTKLSETFVKKNLFIYGVFPLNINNMFFLLNLILSLILLEFVILCQYLGTCLDLVSKIYYCNVEENFLCHLLSL